MAYNMKILIVNHHLVNFAGTEVFTLELAKGLKRRGHKVVIYSKFIDKLAPFFDREDIKFTNNLSLLKEEFDIAHVHHNISAIEVRNAFPHLPIFYLSHGTINFLEQPPQIDVNISRYGAVSPYIKNKLHKQGIPLHRIDIVNNIVDEKRFKPKRKLHDIPRRALILSAKMDEEKEKIVREACKKLNIKVNAVGGRFGEVAYYGIPYEINKADIVFSIGRGVIESMMCGRIPIVYDIFGGDGMVNEINMDTLKKRNFTGKTYAKNYTVKELIKEMQKYRKEQGEILHQTALKNFSLESQIPIIENIYKKTIAGHTNKKFDKDSLASYINTIKISILYQSQIRPSRLRNQVQNYRQELNEIKSSKFFKLWPLYVQVKNFFKFN